MNRVIKCLKITVITILSIVLLINVYILIQAKTNPNSVPSIFGYKPFVVLSGSMETKIYVGDLVFVKEVDPSLLEINDIIAFRDNENFVVTHRIVSIVNEGNERCYKTKGDNNNTIDEDIVCSNSIEGKYYSKIPKIGNIIIFIQQPLGFAVMMLSILIVCIFIYIISNRKIDKQISDEELKEFEEFKKFKKQKETNNK